MWILKRALTRLREECETRRVGNDIRRHREAVYRHNSKKD